MHLVPRRPARLAVRAPDRACGSWPTAGSTSSTSRASTSSTSLAVQPAGFGDLALRFEELKARLAAEGLFDAGRKRSLPVRPPVIAVATSATGAVWHDIRNVLERRWPLARVVLATCQVQGEPAPASIVAALGRIARYADQCVGAGRPADAPVVTILARGGGSLEDLWSFNDERVVRAIVAHPLPLVCGVGHETDVTLADFAADVRAPTPSAAAELVVPGSGRDRRAPGRRLAAAGGGDRPDDPGGPPRARRRAPGARRPAPGGAPGPGPRAGRRPARSRDADGPRPAGRRPDRRSSERRRACGRSSPCASGRPTRRSTRERRRWPCSVRRRPSIAAMRSFAAPTTAGSCVGRRRPPAGASLGDPPRVGRARRNLDGTTRRRMSDLAALGLLALVVVVAAVGGLVVGRMIATRIDRWQERAGSPAAADRHASRDRGAR